MLVEAIEFMKKTQVKRNELKLKLIQVNNRIEELNAIDVHTKVSKQELLKCKEQQRVLEEDIESTKLNENENPATYTTNKLTVRRACDNSSIILRFMQLLCENHNINL